MRNRLRAGIGVVSKLNSAGSALLYSTYLGGTGGSQVLGLAIDGAGDAFVAGTAFSADFPTTTGAYKTTCGTDGACNHNGDGFLSKLNPTGSALLYSTFFGGNNYDCLISCAVAVDAAGAAYVAGDTSSVDYPTTPGALRSTKCTTGECGVITKFTADGSAPAVFHLPGWRP